MNGFLLKISRHQNDGVRFILQREEEAFSQRLAARLCQAVGIQYAKNSFLSWEISLLITCQNRIASVYVFRRVDC